MSAEPISFARQLHLLLERHRSQTGKPLSIRSLAGSTGISVQALLNLADGSSLFPRLDTARALCRFFGIALDYFNLETEAECMAYLAAHQPDSMLRDLSQEANSLTPRGRRNVLAIMEWIRRAVRATETAER
ncbi:MAG: helix-turn-helix domain-containing protein [Anaerolineae bacterium]|nr:helix-turn-helix domain-containing protein [Anaerolineae bacterium]NUQ06485.1 helix-turn-helix transcriptional regulator [Anaerolineae bacterium]